MLQNLPVVVTLGRHDRRTNLAQAYAMAPSCYIKGEALWNSVPNLSPFYYEG